MLKLEDMNGTTLIGDGRRKKFCARCGEMMRGDASSLKRHCKRQHDGMNHGFLQFGQLPQKSKYSNFPLFLQDPSIPLEVDPDFKDSKAGRPAKMIQATIESALNQESAKPEIEALQ